MRDGWDGGGDRKKGSRTHQPTAGLVEGQQTKFYAEPVNVLAGRLGLPQWLVDLRHEATHSQLPSRSSLRMGAQQLLDWLYREYWQKQVRLRRRRGGRERMRGFAYNARTRLDGIHPLNKTLTFFSRFV